jgi:hypothetical protein
VYKTGAVAMPSGLRGWLYAMNDANLADIWLWAQAYDVFVDDRFRQFALDAKLPRNAPRRGFALLRLHQLTGDMHWVAKAKRLAARAPNSRFMPLDAALFMAELSYPERAVLPPFSWPMCSREKRHRSQTEEIRPIPVDSLL